jgi:hypothetical protein
MDFNIIVHDILLSQLPGRFCAPFLIEPLLSMTPGQATPMNGASLNPSSSALAIRSLSILTRRLTAIFQRGYDRDEQSMVAGAPQGLSAPARGKPASGCQDQKDLLVGAPRQSAGHLLRSRRSVVGDRLRDGDICSGWPDGDRKAWTAAREIC